ncbi:myosin heavy chain IB-like [Piliocolobus tephrosceles]|uniref:myosin heavy chain IB-like n=1 Tax=Piliocolobus tephrosceles TaxID=591936 RepID=UPI00130136C0|nr:myosin heavy chain IB-like [Piliocolobus tephrosceles]
MRFRREKAAAASGAGSDAQRRRGRGWFPAGGRLWAAQSPPPALEEEESQPPAAPETQEAPPARRRGRAGVAEQQAGAHRAGAWTPRGEGRGRRASGVGARAAASGLSCATALRAAGPGRAGTFVPGVGAGAAAGGWGLGRDSRLVREEVRTPPPSSGPRRWQPPGAESAQPRSEREGCGPGRCHVGAVGVRRIGPERPLTPAVSRQAGRAQPFFYSKKISGKVIGNILSKVSLGQHATWITGG